MGEGEGMCAFRSGVSFPPSVGPSHRAAGGRDTSTSVAVKSESFVITGTPCSFANAYAKQSPRLSGKVRRAVAAMRACVSVGGRYCRSYSASAVSTASQSRGCRERRMMRHSARLTVLIMRGVRAFSSCCANQRACGSANKIARIAEVSTTTDRPQSAPPG